MSALSASLIRVLVSVAFLALASAIARAQSPPPADPLQPIAFLVGRWETTSEGQPGTGKGQRDYTRMLGSRFIDGRNRVVYPPQEKNPKGETHEDISVFSFDRARQRFVLRQFHSEGFVNQYTADVPTQPGVVVFTSEAIENIPSGWRARETYTVKSTDEIDEVFELAEPGKEFTLYSHTVLKRVAR